MTWPYLIATIALAYGVYRFVRWFRAGLSAAGARIEARDMFYRVNDGEWFLLGLAISRSIVSATDASRIGFVCCIFPGAFENEFEPLLIQFLKQTGPLEPDWEYPEGRLQERRDKMTSNGGHLPIDDDALDRIAEMVEKLDAAEEQAYFSGASIEWPNDIEEKLTHASIGRMLGDVGADPGA